MATFDPHPGDGVRKQCG